MDSYDQLKKYAVELIENGETTVRIRELLQAEGMSEIESKSLLRQVERERIADQKNSILSSNGQEALWIGIILSVLGLVITIGTNLMGTGQYVFAYGLIFGGIGLALYGHNMKNGST